MAPGTCQIKLTASGKYASEHDLAIRMSPDDLRLLALYTVEDCIFKQHIGGYTTKGFEDTIDWLVAPDTGFPDNLDLPAYTTFFTAMVGHPQVEGYEPGAHDPLISRAMLHYLGQARAQTPRMSGLQRMLARRYEYIRISAEVQQRHREWKRAWWEDWVYPPPSTGNGSSSYAEKETMARDQQGEASDRGANDSDLDDG